MPDSFPRKNLSAMCELGVVVVSSFARTMQENQQWVYSVGFEFFGKHNPVTQCIIPADEPFLFVQVEVLCGKLL